VTNYTFQVKAQNGYGNSLSSASSNSILGASVPSAPIIGTAYLLSNTSANISYTASVNNGGYAITSYTAVSTPGNITATLSTSGSGNITVTGLTANTWYNFSVYATTSYGNSDVSISTNAVGGSGLQPGSYGQPSPAAYSTIQGNFSGANPIGTGSFTFECWVYCTNKTDARVIFDCCEDNGDAGFILQTAVGNFGMTSGFVLNGPSGGNWPYAFEGLLLNTWQHIAIVRNNSVEFGATYIYVDGVNVRAVYAGDNIFAQKWRVGGYHGSLNAQVPNLWAGYIDELRLSNVAIYTNGVSSFTPNTSPLSSNVNTLLLLGMNGTNGSNVFIDSSPYNRSITATGNAKINTSFVKVF
jgi:hypothetical protein